MKRLLHLSDLHFGRDRPELLDPLIAQINALAPDLVAISGDLTQRARDRQFMRAHEMIDRIEAPCLIVPGNHDTPLDNLIERVLMPWRRYRKWIASDLEPQTHDPHWSVVGINSVNPLGWQRGRFSARDIRRVEEGFAGTARDAFRIVVAHHPLEHQPGEPKRLTRGARRARAALARLHTDIILSGHLHSWHADVFAAPRPDAPAMLQVHTGTGLSDRLRGEENDFNLLTLDGPTVHVQRYACRADRCGYDPAREVRFRRSENGWRPA
ncbi:metallophosphoesterase family protein [Tritonibacter scottomollicae]|uniref:metallophosphoesterase family protein n=1 Tax=Tritonibacter scottomollicae TaxID=483013 RepID=UPI003BAD09F6